MQDDLGEFVRETVLSERSIGRGYFRKSVIEELLQRNCREGGELMKEVFALLTLELWHEEFMDPKIV
jgi:hypothetical protein